MVKIISISVKDEKKEKKVMRRFIHCFTIFLFFAIAGVLAPALYMQATMPDRYYVVAGEQLEIHSKFDVQTQASQSVYPTDVYASTGNQYKIGLNMMGLVPIKEVAVSVVDRQMVVPCGTPFGIKMFTDGVMVVGIGDVQTDESPVNPAKKAGVCLGDIIVTMNGQKVYTNEDVAKIVAQSCGEPIKMTIRRKDQELELKMTPVKSCTDESFRAGIWVRDSSAGIGTLTYYDPNKMTYGGLGHAICDIDTGKIMPLYQGEIVAAQITGVTAGVSGTPGELKGSLVSSKVLGDVKANDQTGVYGTLNTSPSAHEAVPLALKNEVKTGPATILTTISGDKPQEYNIMIEKVNFSDSAPTKKSGN